MFNQEDKASGSHPTVPRRNVLKWASATAAAIGTGAHAAEPPSPPSVEPAATRARDTGALRKGMLGFMLAHEQFTVPQLLDIGAQAAQGGFDLLATSDHFQPWQANEGHSGLAWVTLAALGAKAPSAWMGTTVTCPILRYHPSVVAESFASLSHLYPGRIFLGVGSGEALNEQAATGAWPAWQVRWDRLIEAIAIIRALWSGNAVNHKGKYYTVNARLYDPPPRPIPILTAANGPKAMRLAGAHGDGLITDPKTWKEHKGEWEAGARQMGKNTAQMPVLVEQFAVVGDTKTTQDAAELWRFIPKAFKGYHNIPDPAAIQKRAEAEQPFEKVTEGWAIGTDPAVHIKAIKDLFASGVTIVNVHAGQPDQKVALDFYSKQVLPQLTRQL
jgi:TAT-translocated FGD2 family F420-dependent dehydrogenase